ncbi:serine hydrolase domain-containing protein [Mesoplasma tabanidae]|uniref:serine hydrolase domain-containing protein n=1 Tax=Mesoplasma tabanidae TaxID=219745 RepID=UPI001FCA3D2B|nr:serine hydrolase domain-containing protein [Mesoplasma tabanidae]
MELKIKEFISKGLYPGAVVKIDVDGVNLYHSSFGYNDIENMKPMSINQIFPIYSMTKPIVIIAALLLVQEKLISLDTKICNYYSKFNKKIKLKNLLNMTSGIPYSWNSKNYENELLKIEELIESDNFTLNEICEMISEIPIQIEPGEEWIYGMNIDILGGIIEKISGMSLSNFLKQKILIPLDMKDTDFKITDSNRKAIKYSYNVETSNRRLYRDEYYHYLMPKCFDKTPKCCLGGSGLFSTAEDYNKFLNFLLTGKIKGKQYLNKKWLNEMSTNQIPKLRNQKIFDLNEDYRFGYGIRVRVKNENFPLTEIGEFGWGGILGTSSLVDPKNKIVMSFMVSVYPGNNSIVENELFYALYKDLKYVK